MTTDLYCSVGFTRFSYSHNTFVVPTTASYWGYKKAFVYTLFHCVCVTCMCFVDAVVRSVCRSVYPMLNRWIVVVHHKSHKQFNTDSNSPFGASIWILLILRPYCIISFGEWERFMSYWDKLKWINNNFHLSLGCRRTLYSQHCQQ